MTGRATKDQFFQLETPGGRVLGPPDGRSWGPIEKNYLALKEDNRIWFGLSGNNVPRVKQFLSESEGQTVPTYWGYDDVASKESLQGKTVFFVDENALVACFDTDLTEDLVKELAHFKPLRVVFRDTGFASDAVKINATQIFRQMSPGTEVKAI